MTSQRFPFSGRNSILDTETTLEQQGSFAATVLMVELCTTVFTVHGHRIKIIGLRCHLLTEKNKKYKQK